MLQNNENINESINKSINQNINNNISNHISNSVFNKKLLIAENYSKDYINEKKSIKKEKEQLEYFKIKF